MDLQKYFASLGEALVAGGMPKAQSEAYCKRLSAMLESLDENTRQEKLANYGSPEDLAKRVLSISDKQKAESRTDADHKKASDDTENKNPSLEHTVNVSRDNRKAMPKMDATKPIPVVHTNESTVGSKTQNIQVASAPEREPAAASAKPTVSVAEKSEENKKPISKRGMQIFWWTAGLSSPITLFLLGCVAGLFLLGYLAILFTAVFMIVAVTVTVVLGMRMMGALLISSLVIFPALSAMKLCRSFRSVVLCSALISVLCFVAGLVASYFLETPTGASIVIANLAVYLLFSICKKQ